MAHIVIFGPASHYGQATADELKKADMSTTLLFNTLVQGKDGQLPDSRIPLWADVRNVAQALYEGPVRHKNERYAICNGQFDYQILANTAGKNFPQLKEHIPLGKPNEPTPLTKGSYALDGSRAERELGIKCASTFHPVARNNS
jgi:nucleoside-diphosphate-sugar epimerase